MKTKQQIKQWLLENCVNSAGNLDLMSLDFSDFDGDIFIGRMKVKNDLFQGEQEVNGNLVQTYQKVKGSLYQDNQEVESHLYQGDQKVKGLIVQDNITEER